MSTSTISSAPAIIIGVEFTADALHLRLADGREVSAPLAWYPRLASGTATERANHRLIGGGHGVHWPELDEDISVENVLSGKASGESQASLKAWLSSRAGLQPQSTGK